MNNMTENTMTEKEALVILHHHRDWRTYPNVFSQNIPKNVGQAIDVAIRVLEARQMETIDNI